jgi:flagellar hook protein FlgE
MQQSFWNATSGLKTQQFGVDSWANNIANINTVGFKANKPQFTTLFESYLSSNNSNSSVVSDKSFGTSVSSNKVDFSAGALKSTKSKYDLAIEKNGFFVLEGNNQRTYTRDGSFHLDQDGYLVNDNGKKVQGINLGKIKENIFVSSKDTNKDLAIQDISKLQAIQLPKFAQIQAHQTTKVNVAVALDAIENITPIDEVYDYISKNYIKNNVLIEDEDMGKFYNIKKGDKLSIDIDKKGATTYTYGIDFTTISQLSDKLKQDNPGLTLEYDDFRLKFYNKSGKTKEIDFTNSSENILFSFGFSKIINLNTNDILISNKVNSSQMLDTNVNAFSDGSAMGLNVGDRVSITVDNKEYSLFYGKANETIINEEVKGEEDTFLTLRDFIKKLGDKTHLDIALKDSNISISAKDDRDISFHSDNARLLNILGFREERVHNISKLISKKLQVGTYSNSIPVYNKDGKKSFLQTHYVLLNNKNDILKQKINWDTTTLLTNRDGKSVDLEFYKTILSLDDVSSEIYKKENNQLKKIDNLKIKFQDSQDILYDISKKDDKHISQSAKAGESVVLYTDVDGNSSGNLNGISIDKQGLIKMSFDNNHQEVVARIGLVDFMNAQGLEAIGSNEYKATYLRTTNKTHYKASGEPTLLWDKDGKLSTSIASHTLEQSNVDLSVGLTELIALQRAYGASSKAVTTSDEMEQGAINLKR